MVAVPVVWLTCLMVTLLPDTLTVATPVLLELAVIAPSPGRVTVTSAVRAAEFSVTALALSVMLPAALPMLQDTVLAVVEPSDHI